MFMKRISIILMLLLPLVLTSCVSFPGPTSAITKTFVKNGVSLAVGYGIQQSPEAIPYLRDYAAPVICEASRGTNNNPDWVITVLEENAQAQAALNPQAALIFNTLFAIYQGVYQTYGAEEVQNRAILQAGLEGACEGILERLPPGTNAAARALAKPLPKHLRVR